MKTSSLRFRKVALFSCVLLISQQVLFVPLLAAQDGLGVVNSDGIPNGASVVAGSANIQVNGSNLNINSLSDRTIINWNNFSVGSGNAVNFNQPGLNSAVLNRVISANPSAINGMISSNGNVLLVNPNGIVIGSGGVINTNGFTASVFDIANEDFLDGGDLTFSGNSNASVINSGSIFTGNGGVHLLGNTVINSGLIESSGNINLLSGGTVQLKNGVSYTQADQATIQNGISETAGLIKNSGTIRATGSMEVGGEVYLVAPGGKVFNEGMIAASKANVGGKVVVTGDEVELEGATIDVSAQNGGGQVYIGGGFAGADSNILNAQQVRIDELTTVLANSLANGDGGDVSIWSDAQTEFNGRVEAMGGSQSGNGGYVETSSAIHLVIGGQAFVDTGASNGLVGTWLLDPSDLTVNAPILASGHITLTADGNIFINAIVESTAGNLTLNADHIDVNEVLSAAGTIDLNSNTLSLAADLVAGSGISGTANTVGLFAGGFIEDAIDAAAVNATINLPSGSMGSFIVDKPLTINGSGASAISGTTVTTSSPAITVAANNVTIQNLNLLGTGAVDDVGILLDGVAAPNLTNVTISNVNIRNMDDGIRSIGDIGDGNTATVDVTIAGLSSISPAVFQDFLDSAIDLNDTDGDVVVRMSNVVVADSFFDLNALSTGGDGINLGDIGGADLDGVRVFSTVGDGIHIDEINDGTVEISNYLSQLIAGQGIEFDETIFDSTVLVETSSITSSGNAIQFDDLVDNSEINISRNNLILSLAGDAIAFNSPVDNSEVTIDFNSIIRGSDDGVNIDELFNTEFNVLNNLNITGANGSGLEFDDLVGPFSEIQVSQNSISGGEEGIEFDTDIVGASVDISNNFATLGGTDGIQFKGSISGSQINIEDNPFITGTGGDGIVFDDSIDTSLIFIANNLAINGDAGNGVGFEGPIGLSGILLFNNNVNSDTDHGVFFGDEVDLSGIGVVANRIGAEGDGVKFEDDVTLSLIGIVGNQTFTNGNGIAFSNDGPGVPTIDDSLVLILGNRIDGSIIGGNSPDAGIEFERLGGNSTVIVRGNEIIETDNDGILVLNSITDNALLRIRDNQIGSDGNPVGDFSGDDNGIDIDRVNSTRGVDILENEIFASINAIEFDDNINNSNVRIIDNLLNGVEGNAVQFEGNIRGSANVLIDDNVMNGISGVFMSNAGSIVDDASFIVSNNIIDAISGGSGIRLVNLGSSETVLIDSNKITGGDFGINIIQRRNSGNNGLVEISNTYIVGAANSGIRIRNRFASNTLETTLQENVTIFGGNIGLVFSGPGLSLTGDTLGNTSFIATPGNFIELRDGALFDPGQPTIIDATGVNFDGIDSNTIVGFGQIEARVIHFIDDPTLGLFWPGFEPLNDLTYDQFERHADLFETIQALIGSGNPGTMNYGDGGNAPNSDDARGGTIPEQKANSYDVFGN